MLLVGKMEKMEPKDFYNDDWNIDEMEAKLEVPEDMRALIGEGNNRKITTSP